MRADTREKNLFSALGVEEKQRKKPQHTTPIIVEIDVHLRCLKPGASIPYNNTANFGERKRTTTAVDLPKRKIHVARNEGFFS